MTLIKFFNKVIFIENFIMHKTVKNLIYIEELIKSKLNHDKLPIIIAVSKTFPIESILPLLERGHLHYGENKVQEALEKWSDIKPKYNEVKLHLIGKLQTNKVKFALKIFDYIHSLDSEKLAIKISEEQIKQEKNSKVKIIAVSKTFSIEKIIPLIEHGHKDFGENKVQEALDKWTEIKIHKKEVKLHLIGKLQTNKVKLAIKLFDYIHSLDNEKLANKIANEQVIQNKRPKIFIQVNIGNEDQKSGIKKENLIDFYNFCKSLNLDIIGTMCIPPNDEKTANYFSEMSKINQELNFKELSMGMSGDYLEAIENNSTYVRLGSKIFGSRT